MKRVFGIFEAVFDICYLMAAFVIGFLLLLGSSNHNVLILGGIMAFVLAGGDAFHLLPRIKLIFTHKEESLRVALGRGKQITSITMTVFYLLLWHIGLLLFSLDNNSLWTCIVYLLAAVRILICLLPQNKWQEQSPSIHWGIWRNIPFFLLGAVVAGLFFMQRSNISSFRWMWLSILLSFAFYLPVVLWSNKNPKIGMLMLPKTCAYLWMLVMFLSF